MRSKGGIEFPDTKKDPTGAERRAVECVVDALNGLGVETVVLNDFTHADFLVRFNNRVDRWFQIQVKTSARLYKNGWGFGKCNQYPGMLIALVAITDDLGWIVGGNYAAAQKQMMRISRGRRCKHNSHIIEASGYCNIAQGLLAMIFRQLRQLTTCTELAARSHLGNPKHTIEFEGIMQWVKHVAEPSGYRFQFPRGQALSYDGECFKDGQLLRVQFKTATPAEYSGFNVSFWRQGGRVNGRNTTKPYVVGDADLYVVIRIEGCNMDVWTFDEATLAGNNPNSTFYVASTDGIGGKKSFAVHVPEAIATKFPSAKNNMLWTRSAHVRYEI